MVPTNELEGFARKSRALKIGVAVLLIAVVAALILIPAEEQPVPDFDLPLLAGGGSLSSDELKGRPVVMNFWASWCGPCREEARLLQRAYERYQDQGVLFVGVNVQDTDVNARRFVDEYGITFPIVTDDEEEVSGGLDVIGLPQTFFITRGWTLASTRTGDEVGSERGTQKLGAISATELEDGIDQLLDDEG